MNKVSQSIGFLFSHNPSVPGSSPGGPKKKSRPHRGRLFFLGVYTRKREAILPFTWTWSEETADRREEEVPWMPSSPKANTFNEFPLGKRSEATYGTVRSPTRPVMSAHDAREWRASPGGPIKSALRPVGMGWLSWAS